MGVGLDGEELGAQGGYLAREEAGGEEAVEAEGLLGFGFGLEV